MNRISAETSHKISTLGFVCALLVVFIHVNHAPSDIGSPAWIIHRFLKSGVATIAVPFFFTISGFFVAQHSDEPGWWRNALHKRICTLLMPFLFWNSALFLFGSLFVPLVEGLRSGCVTWEPLTASSVFAQLGLDLRTYPKNVPLWYLRALYLLVLISPATVFMVRKFWKIVLPILFAMDALNYWGIWPLTARFWFYGFCLRGLFYFAVGTHLCFHKINLSKTSAISLGIVGFVLGCVRVWLLQYYDSDYLAPFTIPLLLLSIWYFTPSTRLRACLVGNSFVIFVTHMFCIRIFAKLPLPLPSNSLLTPMIEWGFAVVGSLAFAILLRRTFPRFATLVFGGR